MTTAKLNDEQDSVPLRVSDRIERMEIMFGIERLLLDWTKRLSSQSQAIGHDQDFMESIPVDTPIGRALRIIFRI